MPITSSNNLHLTSKDVTRWDLFTCVAGRPEGIALSRLANILHVDRERSLIVPLGSLQDEGLILGDSNDRYIFNEKSAAAQSLRQTLSFAMASKCDYNAYFTEDMIAFLKKAYRSDHFTTSDVPAKLLKPDLLCRLVRDNLLLIYSYEPFTGRMVENMFLDGLCDYLKIKRAKSFFSMFRKKVPLEEFIENREQYTEDKGAAQYKAMTSMFRGKGLEKRSWGPPPLEVELFSSVAKEDAELFDPASTDCFKRAWDKMHEYSREGKPLTVGIMREYHQLAMANTDFGGVYRNHDVVIANNPNFHAAPIQDIPRRLKELAECLESYPHGTLSEILDMCAYSYNEFVHIHPFQDGNSRTARVVLGHVLNYLHMPFEQIPDSFTARFLIVTKGLEKRDDEAVKYVLEEIYLNSMNRRELAEAIGTKELQ